MIFEKISLHRRFIACIQNIHWKVYIKIMMYSFWDVRQNKGFLSFWAIFLHFDTSNNPKNQNFEKLKKMPADIIILHLCTLQMTIIWCMVEIWSMTDRHFCHFGLFSAHPNNLENKNFEKMKKAPGDISFYTSLPWQSYDVWFWRYEVQQNFLSFWAIFNALLPH